MWGFRVEPAAVSEFGRQIMYMLILFGVIHWTPEQQMIVLAVISAGLAVITRTNSTSERTLNRAGTSTEEVKQVAANPTQVLTVSQMSDPPR